jgi:uncharacterized protein (DUF1015 family)
LSEVIAPPYDVISPEYQHRLYERDPRNVVRLILNSDPDSYSSAAQLFRQWQGDGTLVRDERPGYYLLRQSFLGPDGGEVVREGLIGLCRLEEFDKKIVLPHEKTHARPKEDRLKLFHATESNFSQVFALYDDPKKTLRSLIAEAASSPADADVSYEGVRNRLWRLQDETLAQRITKFFADKQILIADGHHRYETAVAYRNARRAQDPSLPADTWVDYVMMYLTNSSDEGLVVLPTHRIIHSLQHFDADGLMSSLQRTFSITTHGSPDQMMRDVQGRGSGTLGLVLQEPAGCYVLSLKQDLLPSAFMEGVEPEVVKRLDVAVLHFGILRSMLGISPEAQEQKTNLEYCVDAVEAVSTVRKGYAQAAFFLNPTPVEQVYAVALAGYTMPQKSTFFYPKLLSGLVLHSHRA